MVAGNKKNTSKTIKDFCVLVLAGGKGTRMKSTLPKPLHEICGDAILAHILRTAQALRPDSICILLGHQNEFTKKFISDRLEKWGITTKVNFAVQKELSGSATAVKDSLKYIGKYKDVLILSGDAPLVRAATLSALYNDFKKKKAGVSVFTVEVPDPHGYGRIIRGPKNEFLEIVEEILASDSQKSVKEVNAGMYIFNIARLKKALPLIKPKGAKNEYHLPAAIQLIGQMGGGAVAYKGSDYTEALGINSKKQLFEAGLIMRARKTEQLMDQGVTIIHPLSVHIDNNVVIGADTLIYPNVYIFGKTKIGTNCVIEPGCMIKDSVIGDNSLIRASSYIDGAEAESGVKVGPMAHLRPGTLLKTGARVGNFSETKKAVIGKGSKVNHLTYVGDAVVGDNVNIGAGTITCNYDGVNKHQTVIGDNVFVGSNTNFVAPVKIGAGAVTGAGSTITEDVPGGMLAIARARQVTLNKKIKKGKKK